LTVGDSDPEIRELEAVGWNRGNYHPFHTIWNNFRAPVAGKYRVRWCGYTIWTGPHGVSAADLGKEGERGGRKPKGRWNSPDGDTISRGRARVHHGVCPGRRRATSRQFDRLLIRPFTIWA
jgi:hypothetical protein